MVRPAEPHDSQIAPSSATRKGNRLRYHRARLHAVLNGYALAQDINVSTLAVANAARSGEVPELES